ncbi:nuclear transport factor 2 family protein [Sphingobium tyrosinilyticum]|uniref:Nuclear transport factor 2 family protein n=1 Tax=Sphingobium tyrosinilyticum TaxID=2715436 RepID=A0ABV9EY03_9SPHN
MQDLAILDRFYGAICMGDLDTAVACLTPNARIWNNGIGMALSVDQIRPGWEQMIAATKERGVADIQRYATAQGCVQQHVFFTRDQAGARHGLACCLVVRIKEGLIDRLEEYCDIKSTFPLAEGAPVERRGK